MKQSWKILLSVLLLLIFVACFVFMPLSRSHTVSSTITVSPVEQRTDELVTQSLGISKLLELIGIGALVLAAWLWRKELGITHLGPFGGPDIVTQQEAGAPPRKTDDSEPPPGLDLGAISKEMADSLTKEHLTLIMQMFKNMHSINASSVALKLGVSVHTAKTYLFLLTKSGQLRADGFPKHTIYTPAHSIENRILNATRKYLSETYGELSERRYVRIGRSYEVDALLESESTLFLVEAKILRNSELVLNLERWIQQLLKVAKEFRTGKISCVLAVACIGSVDINNVRKQADGLTYDSGSIPLHVLVLSESELPE